MLILKTSLTSGDYFDLTLSKFAFTKYSTSFVEIRPANIFKIVDFEPEGPTIANFSFIKCKV